MPLPYAATELGALPPYISKMAMPRNSAKTAAQSFLDHLLTCIVPPSQIHFSSAARQQWNTLRQFKQYTPSAGLTNRHVSPAERPRLPAEAKSLTCASQSICEGRVRQLCLTSLAKIGSLQTCRNPVTGLVVHSIADEEMKRECSSSPTAAGSAIGVFTEVGPDV